MGFVSCGEGNILHVTKLLDKINFDRYRAQNNNRLVKSTMPRFVMYIKKLISGNFPNWIMRFQVIQPPWGGSSILIDKILDLGKNGLVYTN